MDKKEQVAREALNYILKGDVVGLGSGTTASQVIKLLGQSDIKDRIDFTSLSFSENLFYLIRTI